MLKPLCLTRSFEVKNPKIHNGLTFYKQKVISDCRYGRRIAYEIEYKYTNTSMLVHKYRTDRNPGTKSKQTHILGVGSETFLPVSLSNL